MSALVDFPSSNPHTGTKNNGKTSAPCHSFTQYCWVPSTTFSLLPFLTSSLRPRSKASAFIMLLLRLRLSNVKQILNFTQPKSFQSLTKACAVAPSLDRFSIPSHSCSPSLGSRHTDLTVPPPLQASPASGTLHGHCLYVEHSHFLLPSLLWVLVQRSPAQGDFSEHPIPVPKSPPLGTVNPSFSASLSPKHMSLSNILCGGGKLFITFIFYLPHWNVTPMRSCFFSVFIPVCLLECLQL